MKHPLISPAILAGILSILLCGCSDATQPSNLPDVIDVSTGDTTLDTDDLVDEDMERPEPLLLSGMLVAASQRSRGDDYFLEGFITPHVSAIRSAGGDLTLDHLAFDGF